MFEHRALQSLVDGLVTVPHTSAVTSPYSFYIEPSGATHGAEYKVVGERFAFQLRVRVEAAYLAVGLRSAIIAGAAANPGRVAQLRDALSSSGWKPGIDLGPDSFRIEAMRDELHELSDSALMEAGVVGACLLSAFVLDQLVVTKPYGEMRPATHRRIAEDREPGDPWLYDPEERDRSTAVHQALENWLISVVGEAGITALDAAGEPYFDLAWHNGQELVVCEVKSTVNSETKQLRLAIGQLLHYLALLRKGGNSRLRGVILIPSPPTDQIWFDIASDHGLEFLWPERWPEVSASLTGRNLDGHGLLSAEDSH